MTDLRDLFARAGRDVPHFDADAVRRVVGRRRFRRRALRVASGVLVVAAGVSVAASLHHSGHQVVVAPGGHATTSRRVPLPSSPTTTTLAPSPTGPVGILGYAQVKVDPAAFRGYGQLAYYSGGALRILDGDGGPPRSVSLPGAPERVSWSADGKWLAVQTNSGNTAQNGEGDLYVLGADSGPLTRVIVTSAAAGWRWSPTSDVLAVVDQGPTARGGTIDVFAAPEFGRPAVRTRPADSPAGLVAWSTDGQHLLYSTYNRRPPLIDKLWSVDESRCPRECGTSETEIPVVIRPKPTEDLGFIFAGWSADGTRLLVWLDAYHSGSVALDGMDVASIAANGGVDTQLPDTLSKPSWIASVPGSNRAIMDVGGDRFWDAHRQLDSCDLDSGGCSALVVSKGPVLDPAVSPDGSRLAYVVSDPDVFANNALLPPKSSIQWSRSRRLVVAGVDNEDPKVIAKDGVVAPRWAADSKHLLFWRAGYIWLVDAAHPAPVAVAGQVAGGTTSSATAEFEDNAYIWPGNDVWDTVAWKP